MQSIKVFVADFNESYLNDERILSLGQEYFGAQWKPTRPMIITLLGQMLVHYVFRITFPDKELPKYDYNENGKPFFADYPDFQFNISDSKQRVVAAFDTEELGVDVEYLRTHRPELMQRFFSDEERQSVEKQSDDEAKGRAFTMLWSLKEALVKCLGTGIAKDFTNYSVDFENESVAPAESGLVLSGTVLDGDCFVTLCRRGEKPQFDFRFVGIEEILDVLKNRKTMKIRVGLGIDVHQLEEGLPFWLGGIRIPHSKGAKGHSDADVLIHAICDAMLGAANLGDIGKHFPDNDPQYKGIDSKILLAKTYELVRQKGYELGNCDSVVCLQKPKIADYLPQMRQTLAEVLGVDEDDISIKATTTEHLGFEGREEGVSAYATVLLVRNSECGVRN